MIEAGPVEREEELKQILDLQRTNLPRQLSAEEIAAEGFVTVEHTLDVLKRMHAIAPSIIETPLTAPIKARPAIYDTYANHTVIGRWGHADEVASAVAFLASDAASYITGSTLLIDAGWTGVDGPPTGLTQTAS